MRFVSYLNDGHDQLGVLYNGLVYNVESLHPSLPVNMGMLLNYWHEFLPLLHSVHRQIEEGDTRAEGRQADELFLLSPIPSPVSLRDGYAFRQHVETARKNRGLEMIPEFDEFPVFYFSNHNSVTGPGEIRCMPDHFFKLDFELEVAIVIARPGRNIRASEADEYIGGFMIMNDFSARGLQMEEMKLNLGPAKGKDFATALGPVLVTPDELQDYRTDTAKNHTGASYNMTMKAFVNGALVSEGNLRDMTWTFAELIERASYGTQLFAGDVIGSGTVGTGCFLELNGSRKSEDAAAPEQWLQEGDEIVLEVEGLGRLVNTIVADEDNFSIFEAKSRN